MKINPQLNFGGNCEEAFQFYAHHLGGEITFLMRQREMPSAPSDAGDAVIHARLTLGDLVLVANDVPPHQFQPIRSVYLLLSVDSAAEAERVHALLAAGGDVYMPLQETFYATRFSQLRDRFGVAWSIVHERPRA